MLRVLAIVFALLPVGAFAAGPTADQYLVTAVYMGDVAAVERHLANPVTVASELNPECPVSTRCRPITFAAELPEPTILKMLLKAGADPNGRGAYDDTPLIAAMSSGHFDNVPVLLEHGADPNLTNYFGISALSGAIMGADASLVKALLEGGGNPNASMNYKSNDGTAQTVTMLMMAIKDRRADVVEILLSHGADPWLKSSRGSTPLEYAMACRDQTIIAMIQTAVLQAHS